MASTPPVPPITNQFPIVTADGRPSDYFIRWLQERGFEINGSVTPEQVAQLIQEWAAARSVIAGPGLAGGGSLDSDVTLNLNAVLGQLNDVDFTTPPTDGQVIVYDAVSSTWKPADQSGGGGVTVHHSFGEDPGTGAGTTYGGGFWFGNLITIDQDGTIDTVVYALDVAEIGINAVPVIYADNAGNAGALLADGPQVNNGNVGDNNLPLSTPLAVTAGQQIWVGCYQASTGSIVPTKTAGAVSKYFIGTPPPANPGGSLTSWVDRLRLFATGTVVVTAGKPWYWNPPKASDFTVFTGTIIPVLSDDADVGMVANFSGPVGGDAIRSALMPLSPTVNLSNPWQVTAKMRTPARSADFVQTGIEVRDSTKSGSTRSRLMFVARNNGHYTGVTGNNNNTRSADLRTSGAYVDPNGGSWFRIYNDLTNLWLLQSSDGKNWSPYYRNTIGGFAINPDQAGVCTMLNCSNFNNAYPETFFGTVEYWKIENVP